MTVKLFEIQFDDAEQNPQAVYRSGQAVSCRIHLVLDSPVKCRNVAVQIFGASSVRFTRSSGRSSSTYRSEEVYIDEKQAVFVPPTEGPDAEHHPAGEFVYQLSFKLPPALAPSFEGVYGAVRYYVGATIDRPWHIDDRVKRFFTVVHDFDLNHKPMSLVGPFKSDEEDEGQYLDFDGANCCCTMCCCYLCGKIQAKVQLDKLGYVPGEMILVKGEIYNGACHDVNRISLQILQQSTFLAEDKQELNIRVAASTELPGVPKGRKLQLNNPITVPAVACSQLTGCSNIQLNYLLRIVARNSHCATANVNCCELVIGTGILRNLPAYYLMPSSTAATPAALPTTTYCECVFGRKDIPGGDEGGHSGKWAPSYPVFSA